MAEKLTKQQLMAVKDRGGKLLVSAAAGSGKTKVLVDRLISYLMDPVDPANLDEFLIITYTKAAAAELRGKIAAKLTELIARNPENRHLRRQMQRLYLTKISTVHSFCADILKEYAYKLDIPSDFRVADETECAQLQLQVLDKILDEAYESAGEDPDFCAFVDTQGLGRDDRQIPQILLKVYQSAKCHLDPQGWLQWSCNCSDTEGIYDAAQTIWGRYLLDDLHASLDLHIDALSRCVALANRSEGMEKPSGLLEQTVRQLQHLRAAETWDEVLQRKDIEYGRLTFSKACTDIDLTEKIKAIRNNCKASIEKKLSAFADSSERILEDLRKSSFAARGLIKLTQSFSAEYDKRKRARRVLDFGDLEHRMLDLLLGKKRSAPTIVADEIGARYREIMVDEYQDSNGVQDAIFEALTRKRNNCFMVGDVKQSIYQFRLADPGIFVEKYKSFVPAEEAIPGQSRKILLSNNFRSSHGVISAVNDVFCTCMSEKVGGLLYGEDELLREGIPHVDLCEPEVELYGIDVQQDTYAEEAAFVARRIQALLDGKHMVREGDALRPVAPDDIVILLRSPGSVGGEFAFALEKCGIRCCTGGSTNLLQVEEISVLHSILQIINNPLQDIPLIAVLASYVFGFTADDLAALRRCDHRCSIYDALCRSGDKKAVEFLDILNKLRADARVLTLSELLHRIFRYTRMDSICAAMSDGEIRTHNLQSFCQLVSDYENTGQRDLPQFLSHLSALEEKGLVLSGQQQEQGAVTIMSIHKSKGLEFPVVFLCGLSRRFNQESSHEQVLCHKDLGLGLSCVDSKNRIRYPTIAKRAISTKIMEEGISEELRVLYVAMTRPKDRLIMTYASNNLEGDLQDIGLRMDLSHPLLLTSDVSCPGSWVLQTAMRRTEAGALFALGGHPGCVKPSDQFWMIKTVTGSVDEQTLFKSQPQQIFIPTDITERIAEGLKFQYGFESSTKTPSKQTATQLKGRFKDLEAAEHTSQIYAHDFRKADFAAKAKNKTAFGNAMHAVMQYISYEACTDITGVSAEIRRLVQEQYISTEYGEIADANKIAALFATEIGQKLRSGTPLLREFKFSILDSGGKYALGSSQDEILLQGVVDCAILEPDGITVIDYKTDYVTEQTLQAKADSYSGQVRLYANALERIYKQKVKTAYLYFFCLDRFTPVEID